jgi:hypothetical protein
MQNENDLFFKTEGVLTKTWVDGCSLTHFLIILYVNPHKWNDANLGAQNQVTLFQMLLLCASIPIPISSSNL